MKRGHLPSRFCKKKVLGTNGLSSQPTCTDHRRQCVPPRMLTNSYKQLTVIIDSVQTVSTVLFYATNIKTGLAIARIKPLIRKSSRAHPFRHRKQKNIFPNFKRWNAEYILKEKSVAIPYLFSEAPSLKKAPTSNMGQEFNKRLPNK